MRKRLVGSLLLAASLAATACGSDGAAAALPAGRWGGEGVSLDVTSAAVALEFDCAHGRVEGAWRVGGDGAFDVAGRFISEHGGPVRGDEAAAEHPASYRGRLDGKRVTFEVRLSDDDSRLGPFSAEREREPVLRKCLASAR